MCDYCSCRRHPVIAVLSEEHARIEPLASALEAAHALGHVERVRATAGALVAALEPHTAREEHGLFAELEAAGAGGHTGQLRGEHAELDAVFAAVAAGGRAAWPKLPGALRTLERHILREEQDLFPAADQLLAPEAWERVNEPDAGPIGTAQLTP